MAYELSPWKVDLCKNPFGGCPKENPIAFSMLPPSPSPDRLIGYDHAHITARYSADQRIGREDETWRSLVFAIGRRFSEGDVIGRLVHGGRERSVVVPPHKDRRSREAWLRDD